MRFWPCLLLLAAAQPAWAGERQPPYYGPAKRWHGIGYKFGYEDAVEKDGTWRVDAAIHGGGADAIDMALYRAAERAREAGYKYIFFLGGSGSKAPGIDQATVYARPSNEAVVPAGCRSKKITSCYTADVAEVLRILGGPGGKQPGVPVVDHRDEFGREVILSGYGTGGVASLVPGGMPHSHITTIVENRPATLRPANAAPTTTGRMSAAAPFVAVPAPTVGPAVVAETFLFRPRPPSAAATRFEQAERADQPVRGREPKLGWTITD